MSADSRRVRQVIGVRSRCTGRVRPNIGGWSPDEKEKGEISLEFDNEEELSHLQAALEELRGHFVEEDEDEAEAETNRIKKVNSQYNYIFVDNLNAAIKPAPS